MRLDLCSKKRVVDPKKGGLILRRDVDMQGTTVGAAFLSPGDHVCHSRELVWGVGLQLLTYAAGWYLGVVRTGREIGRAHV